MRSCTQERLTFRRSRPHWKNDQAPVEQRNRSVGRKRLGYGRDESKAALAQLDRVYALRRIWTNCWPPSLKLIAKAGDAAIGTTRTHYDQAQTPSRRRLASVVLDATEQQVLAHTFAASRPMALRRHLATAVEQLARPKVRPNERFALENDAHECRKSG